MGYIVDLGIFLLLLSISFSIVATTHMILTTDFIKLLDKYCDKFITEIKEFDERELKIEFYSDNQTKEKCGVKITKKKL